MSGRRTLWKNLFALASIGLLLCIAGELSQAFAQETPSRRLRQYRRPWRSGVVSFGLQGQYGYNVGGTEFTDPFDWGPGLVVTARYVANKWASIGVRFEVHNFDASEDSIRSVRIFRSNDAFPIDSQRITMAGLDFYLYRNRIKNTMQYLDFGAGIYQLTILLPEAGLLDTPSTRTEKDNMYLMAGAGIEHFLRRTITFDLNGKVFAYLGDKEGIPLSIQLAAGLQFYFFD